MVFPTCPNCGTSLPEGAKFCPHCGFAFEEQIAQTEHQPASVPQSISGYPLQQSAVPSPSFPPQQGRPQRNKAVTLAIIGAGVALIIVITLVVVILTQPKTVNLEEYVTLNVNGYNGFATADAQLERDALMSTLRKKTGIREPDANEINSVEKFQKALADEARLEELLDSINVSVSLNPANVKNGDNVEASITYDNDLAKKSHIRFVGDTVSVTAENLEEVKQIDPFEGLDVTFSGVSPDGRLEIEYNGPSDHVITESFEADRWDGLKNGDTVTISIQSNDGFAVQQGYVLSPKEKSYTVSGLDEYVMDYASLSDEFLDALQEDAQDTILAYTAQSYSSTSSIGTITYGGYMFKSIKDNIQDYNSYNYNELYILYHGVVSSSSGDFPNTDVFFPVMFRNIRTSAEGFSYDSNEGIYGFSYLGTGWSSTHGYADPLICYSDLRQTDLDVYNTDIGGGFEVYSDCTYFTSLQDIPEDFQTELLNLAEDAVLSYIASDSYYEGMQVDGMSFVGDYLLYSKNLAEVSADNNYLYIVYSAQVTNTAASEPESVTVYYPVKFCGLVSLGDGTCKHSGLNGIVGMSELPSSWYHTDGYTDGTKMYSDIVTANRDNFKYEVSSGLAQFGN